MTAWFWPPKECSLLHNPCFLVALQFSRDLVIFACTLA
jgi:hypothetical protein